MFVSKSSTAGTRNCVSWRWSLYRTVTFAYTWLRCWLSRRKREEEWEADYEAARPRGNHSRWGKNKIIFIIARTRFFSMNKWQLLDVEHNFYLCCCLHHVRRVFEDSFRKLENRRLVRDSELDGNWRFLSSNYRGRLRRASC